MKIKNLPKHERPREKLLAKGAANLKDRDLLAILLRTGRQGKSVIEMADEILKKHPMKNMLILNYDELAKIKGIGPDKACSLLAAFELTKRALELEDNSLPQIKSTIEAVDQLSDIRNIKKEHFVVLYLNARNQLIHKETISVGTINASLVHPREVFEPALKFLASHIIIAHNHPSGGVEPSEGDLEVTKRLTDAGRLLGIELIDHIIVTKDNFLSINNFR